MAVIVFSYLCLYHPTTLCSFILGWVVESREVKVLTHTNFFLILEMKKTISLSLKAFFHFTPWNLCLVLWSITPIFLLPRRQNCLLSSKSCMLCSFLLQALVHICLSGVASPSLHISNIYPSFHPHLESYISHLL